MEVPVLLQHMTYKKSSNSCEVVEQKHKIVEQNATGAMDDGLDGIFGLNQDETMRIDTTTMETP